MTQGAMLTSTFASWCVAALRASAPVRILGAANYRCRSLARPQPWKHERQHLPARQPDPRHDGSRVDDVLRRHEEAPPPLAHRAARTPQATSALTRMRSTARVPTICVLKRRWTVMTTFVRRTPLVELDGMDRWVNTMLSGVG